MGIHTKTLMVTGSASISGSLHFDGVLPANLVVGSDTNADRKITFGHTNLKSVIGLDSNGATTKFAINTDPDFADAYNDLEIDLAGNVYLHNGDLYVRGGDIYGIENGQLRLHSDTDIVLKLDADNDSSSEFRINDGGGSTWGDLSGVSGGGGYTTSSSSSSYGSGVFGGNKGQDRQAAKVVLVVHNST